MCVLDDFLRKESCEVGTLTPVAGDSSGRMFFRVRRDGVSLVAMSSPPDDDPASIPGHKIADLVRITKGLEKIGVRVPALYAVDETNGFVLLEDFGSVSFGKANEAPSALYGLATDTLIRFREEMKDNNLALPLYYESHIHTGRRRVVDWYIPFVRQEKNEDGLAESYVSVWDQIEQSLPPCPVGFVHGDYHFENLMWLNEGRVSSTCGVLDFQGALWGPLPYDLVNVLEDVRVDVPQDIRTGMMARYCETMSAEEKETFALWYRVLGTQFHCRVMGQFIRLAVRDHKTAYLSHLPRTAALLKAGLAAPVLAPIRDWFEREGICFDKWPDKSDSLALGAYIREDAF